MHHAERSDFARVMIVLGLSSICILMLVYLPIPLIPVWQTQFHVTTSVADWTSSAYGFAYAIGNVFWGMLSDRIRRIKILYIGLFLLTFITVLVGFSPSLALLILFRVLEGVVAASFPAVAIAYIGDVLAPRYRSIATTVVSCGFLVASVLGQVYGSLMNRSFGWHAAFLWLAVVYVLLAIGILLLPKGARPSTQISFASVCLRTIRLFRNIRLVVSWIVAVPILLCFIGMYSGLGVLLSNGFGRSTGDLIEIQLLGIPGIVLSLVAGYAIRYFGAKRVLISGVLIGCLGLILEAVSHSIGLLTLSSVIVVFGLSSAVPGIIMLVGHFGNEARGSATAVYAFFVFVGASLAPLLETALVSSYGVRCFFVVLAGILFLTALLSGFGIRYSSSK
ncbi:MFS transporter [Alicyclobacillus suci]|uniref:MFS transporter n=1 Tax=Alicyclobacillus suci TaxID=2816080 RepID=UPI001A904576|nr:MFS transporter [Alicyclobacillus suci]